MHCWSIVPQFKTTTRRVYIWPGFVRIDYAYTSTGVLNEDITDMKMKKISNYVTWHMTTCRTPIREYWIHMQERWRCEVATYVVAFMLGHKIFEDIWKTIISSSDNNNNNNSYTIVTATTRSTSVLTLITAVTVATTAATGVDEIKNNNNSSNRRTFYWKKNTNFPRNSNSKEKIL